MPGGIFAPSLAAGAGVGDMLRWLFPTYPAGAIVLLGMVAYFTGVVRAPLTAVIIISETTASRGLMMPLLASALIADVVAQAVSKERLYHALSQGFLPPDLQQQHESILTTSLGSPARAVSDQSAS